MPVRRLLLTFLLAAVLWSGTALHADLNYRAEITGAEDSDLADLLDKVSELKTLEDKPPASEETLRRRADRDLGRLADAAHSLGYWDAEFSYDLDTEADPARITVKVDQRPLDHVASLKVLGPEGQPLSIPARRQVCRPSPAIRRPRRRSWRPKQRCSGRSGIAVIPSRRWRIGGRDRHRRRADASSL